MYFKRCAISPAHRLWGCHLREMNLLTMWTFLHMLVSLMCNNTYSFTYCMPHQHLDSLARGGHVSVIMSHSCLLPLSQGLDLVGLPADLFHLLILQFLCRARLRASLGTLFPCLTHITNSIIINHRSQPGSTGPWTQCFRQLSEVPQVQYLPLF